MEIIAFTLPNVCSSLPALIDVTKYAYLTDLKQADHCNGQSSGLVDVLIGSNYY